MLPTAIASIPPSILQPSNLAEKGTVQRIVAAAGSDAISATRLSKDRIRCDGHTLQQALRVLPPREAFRTIAKQLGAKQVGHRTMPMVDKLDGTRTTSI